MDNRKPGSLEPVEQVGKHRVVRMSVEEDIRLTEELAGQCETSAEQEALPSPAEARTYRLFCPFRPCVVSACMHTPCNRPCQLNKTTAERPLGFHRFQLSLQL